MTKTRFTVLGTLPFNVKRNDVVKKAFFKNKVQQVSVLDFIRSFAENRYLSVTIYYVALNFAQLIIYNSSGTVAAVTRVKLILFPNNSFFLFYFDSIVVYFLRLIFQIHLMRIAIFFI